MLGTIAFALCAVAGWRGARRTRRGTWWLVFGLSGFLLVDNLSRLHEHVTLWPLVYAPILAVLAGAALRLSAGSDVAPAVRGGLVLLLISLLIHALSLRLGHALGLWEPDKSRFLLWRYQVLIAVKEGTELAGWMLFAPALLLLARRPAGSDQGNLPTAAFHSRPPSSSAAPAGRTS